MKLISFLKIIISRSVEEYSKKQLEAKHTREIVASIDFGQISDIRDRYEKYQKSRIQFDSRKYLKIDKYVKQFVKIADELSLVEAPPFRVLDIGCGAGWLGCVLNYFGHSVEGIDIEDEVSREIAAVLDVSREETPVLAFKPLPVKGKFDMIVSKGAMFDRIIDRDGKWTATWGIKEYLFFLREVASHLTVNGCFYFVLTGAGWRNSHLTRSLWHGYMSRKKFKFTRPELQLVIDSLQETFDNK